MFDNVIIHHYSKLLILSSSSNHRALLGLVSSIRVRSKSSLFEEKSSKSDKIYKDVEKRLRDKFDTLNFPLKSIENFVQNHIPEFWIGKPTSKDNNGGLKYAPSKYLDFKDVSPMDENWHRFENKLTDFRGINKNKNKSTKADEGKYNEFFIIPKNMDSIDKECLKTWYDVVLLLGIRRDQLFNRDLSERIYNISLPISEVVQIPDKSKKEESVFLLCPIITFHRKPSKVQFRKSISFSLILIPKKIKQNDEKISIQEVFEALWDVGEPVKLKISTDSPLLQFLGNHNGHQDGYLEFTREELIEKIAENTLSLITEDYSKDKENDILKTQIRTSLEKVVTYFKEGKDVERSIILNDSEDDDSIMEHLRMIVYPYHYFIDHREGKQAFQAVFKPKDLMINDNLLFDSSYLLFYNPRESFLTGIHYEKYEEFPKLSMKWYFFLDLYLVMEISLFKVILNSIYRETDEYEDLQHVIKVEKEMVTDLDEFYDLNLSFNSYKDSYAKIKVLGGINESYKSVKDKLDDLKNYFSLAQQRRINLAVIILTAFTVASSLLLFKYSSADNFHIDAFWGLILGMAIITPFIWFKYGKSKD